MTDTERRLAEVLAEHEYAFQLRRGAICTCGFVPDVKPETLRTQQDYHRAHLADALLPVVAEVEAEARAGALREALSGVTTHNGTPVTPKNLRWAATHEALCRSYIFDVLTGLADSIARAAEGSLTDNMPGNGQNRGQERRRGTEGTRRGPEPGAALRTAPSGSDPIIRHDTPDEGGQLDEFIAHGCDMHLERMGEAQWWIGVTTADGREWLVNVGAKSPRAKGYAQVEEDT